MKEETSKEWIFGSLIFVRALGLLLPEDQGIVIELKDNEEELYKVIVYNQSKHIAITDVTDRVDLKEGDFVKLIDFGEQVN